MPNYNGDNYDPFGVATKPQMNLIYLVDTSGSMIDEPINQLNIAMTEAVQVAETTARQNEIDLSMRVVEFNSTAKWLIGDANHGEEHIDWAPLTAYGGTDTAGAINLARDVMHTRILGVRNYSPVVILITDGYSNDPAKTLEAIASLKGSLKSPSDPNKDKIIRIAIGVIGANQAELESFASVGNIEHEDGTMDEMVPLVFNVDNVDLLKGVLKNITISSIMSSYGAGTGAGGGEIVIPMKSKTTGDEDEEDPDWI